MLVFEMPIIRYAEEIGFFRRLLRLVRTFDDTSKYRRFDLCCLKDLFDGFYFVKNADARRRELELEGWQINQLNEPQLVGWQSLKMFSVQPSKGINFYAPMPHGRENEWKRCVGVPTSMMLSYLTDYLRVSGLGIREQLYRIAGAEIEVTTPGAFLCTSVKEQ